MRLEDTLHPNDLTSLSSLFALPVVWAAADTGGILWSSSIIISASISVAYHAIDMSAGEDAANFGVSPWAESWAEHSALLSFLDLVAQITILVGTCMVCGGPKTLLSRLLEAPDLCLWASLGVIAFFASLSGGLQRWPYSVLHSFWHLTSYSSYGALVLGAAPEAGDMLIIGLGNPGSMYEGGKHNLGTRVIQALARRAGVFLTPSVKHAWAARTVREGRGVLLACPDTSAARRSKNKPIETICDTYGIRSGGQVIVIHDEAELPPGHIQLKFGGDELENRSGLAKTDWSEWFKGKSKELPTAATLAKKLSSGQAPVHSGLRAVAECLGTDAFIRVRIGVGKTMRGCSAQWVLNNPREENLTKLFKASVERAADCIEAIIDLGLEKAVASFHNQQNEQDQQDHENSRENNANEQTQTENDSSTEKTQGEKDEHGIS